VTILRQLKTGNYSGSYTRTLKPGD